MRRSYLPGSGSSYAELGWKPCLAGPLACGLGDVGAMLGRERLLGPPLQRLAEQPALFGRDRLAAVGCPELVSPLLRARRALYAQQAFTAVRPVSQQEPPRPELLDPEALRLTGGFGGCALLHQLDQELGS